MRESKQALAQNGEARSAHPATALQAENLPDPLLQRVSLVRSKLTTTDQADILSRSGAAQHQPFLIQLQRQYGNRYVQQVIARSRQANESPKQVRYERGAQDDLAANRIATPVTSNQNQAILRQTVSAPSTVRLPANLTSQVGTVGYYRARYDDYLTRHTVPPPPDYYLGYGEKYAKRFTTVLKPKLSLTGQLWVDNTFRLLQEAIERRRAADPAAFDRLEQDNDRFKDFAYDTHPDAYLAGGLRTLPASDLARIATTPDLGDIMTLSGISQVIETGARLVPQWGSDWLTSGYQWLERGIYNLYGVPYY